MISIHCMCVAICSGAFIVLCRRLSWVFIVPLYINMVVGVVTALAGKKMENGGSLNWFGVGKIAESMVDWPVAIMHGQYHSISIKCLHFGGYFDFPPHSVSPHPPTPPLLKQKQHVHQLAIKIAVIFWYLE